ncbi:hypothetical protein VTH06DRAFT_8392 [Thermothelomyces fergusii]
MKLTCLFLELHEMMPMGDGGNVCGTSAKTGMTRADKDGETPPVGPGSESLTKEIARPHIPKNSRSLTRENLHITTTRLSTTTQRHRENDQGYLQLRQAPQQDPRSLQTLRPSGLPQPEEGLRVVRLPLG